MSFENASVTKGLMVSYGITSILAGIFDVKHYFHLQLVPHLSRHHQYWRLALHHLAFSSSSDLFIAELLLYNVGVHVERRFGSVKFASFALVSTIIATILELLSLILFNRVGHNHITMGPSPLIFSMLYQYSRIVPSTYSYRIFGVPLTNKSMFYLLALQTAISRLPSSGVVAVIGVLVGQMYRSDLANLKAYRISPMMVDFAKRYLLPLVGSLRPPRRTNRALPDSDSRPSSARNTLFSNAPQNDEVITTARPAPSAAVPRPRPEANPISAESDAASGSVMREWVNELTGRTEAPGIRVPPETEIAQLSSMFPHIQRDVIVATLQRR
ncbi:hypothetical protein H0H81_005925 [Sphagnurus paluster]|uniref:Peptidase S54 rhomboid domain-containing protein n=1 Tax=Sphagnurus paluster TaxID=117069 RepID=A0A9P7KL18_9AGAR|nr:hypothetical protein H0H81_005925 [Sphagnurus paluster]